MPVNDSLSVLLANFCSHKTDEFDELMQRMLKLFPILSTSLWFFQPPDSSRKESLQGLLDRRTPTSLCLPKLSVHFLYVGI